MIEYLTFLILSCYVQVSVVATVGVALTSLCLRYRPLAARTLAYTTILLVIGIMLASPVRVPGLAADFAAIRNQQDIGEQTSPTKSSVAEFSTEAVPARDRVPSGSFVGIKLSQSFFAAAKKLVGQKTQGNPWLSTTLAFFAAMIVVGATFGAARFIFAWHSAARIIRHSIEIDDERAQDLVADFCREFSLHENTRLVQSDAVTSAAVIGWKTPHIVLPEEWKNWKRSQLKAVLAHELAHVSAGDFAWRTFSCFVANINWLNPIVSILLRRVMLCQEMIADTVAGQCVGRQGYMRTLSGFALANDTSQLSTSTGIAPVFSGDLIRRIKMLKRMDLTKCEQKAPLFQTAGVAVLLLFGAATFAGHCIAQDAGLNETEAQSIRVAKLPRTSKHHGELRQDPTRLMFQRQPVDLNRHMPYKEGFFCVRIAEWFEVSDPQQIGCLTLLNSVMAQELVSYLSTQKPTKIDLGMVSRLEGSTTLITQTIKPTVKTPLAKQEAETDTKAKPDQDSNHERNNRVMIGFNNFQVHFDHKVDCLDWANRYGTPKDIISKGDVSVWNLPIMPALGPLPMGMANLDENTICMSNVLIRDLPAYYAESSSDLVVKQVTYQPAPNNADWVPMYRRMAGGLATFVYTNHSIRTKKNSKVDPTEFADELELKFGICFDHLLHTFKTYAIGVDLSEDARQVGVRVRIGYDTHEDATDAFTKLRDALDEVRKASNDAQIEEPADAFDAAAQDFLIGLINDGIVEVQRNVNGTSDIYLAGTVNLPSTVGSMIKSLIKEEEAFIEASKQTNSDHQ